MKSKMGMVYAKMKRFLSFLNVPDRKIIVESKLKSILDYGVPLFQSENQMTMNKLEASYMTVNRIIRGGLTYKVSKVKICNDIKCDLPAKHIRKASLSFIHKHLTHRKCSALIDQLIIQKRKSSPIFVSKPQNGIYHGLLDRIIEMYNCLPTEAKTLRPGPFKRYLKKKDKKHS